MNLGTNNEEPPSGIIKYISRNRKYIAGLLVALSLLIAFASSRSVSGPVIQFVGFNKTQEVRTARFRIVNDSGSSYHYAGYSPSSPIYTYRLTDSGEEVNEFWCGTGVESQTIAARSSIEFKVHLPSKIPDAAFAIGIHFARSTGRYSSRISEFFAELRYRLTKNYPKPELTWSTVAQSQ